MNLRNTTDTAVEVGATALGVVAGIAAVSPEVGLFVQGVSALVGGVVGRFVGGAITNRTSAA